MCDHKRSSRQPCRLHEGSFQFHLIISKSLVRWLNSKCRARCNEYHQMTKSMVNWRVNSLMMFDLFGLRVKHSIGHGIKIDLPQIYWCYQLYICSKQTHFRQCLHEHTPCLWFKRKIEKKYDISNVLFKWNDQITL